MKKYLVLVAVALSIGFTACNEDEDVIKPIVSIANESTDNSVAQLDTLYLKAQVENVSEGASYAWTVDGKEVSTSPAYKFTQPKTGEYTIGLTITETDGEKMQSQLVANVYARFDKGGFVLNEGNMTDETGTLTFIDSKGVLLDSAYYRVNGKLLGNVCQDLFIAGNKIYILSQNGAKNGGEGMLTIAQADNLEQEKVCNPAKLSWATNIAVVGEHIYIRDNNGVYLFNASTDAVTLVENSKGAMKNRMAVVEDKVFVMTSSNSILVIKDGAIIHTISAPGALSGIAKSYDGNLWVSCSSPAQILKMNPTDYTIDAHSLSDASIGAGWGVAPAFSAVKDTLYFSNAGFNLYRHIFKENKTEFVANIKESVPDAGIYYNSLGVDPESGEVYFATLKGYGMYKINDIAIFDFSKTPALQHDYKQKNSFPAGVFFTSYF